MTPRAKATKEKKIDKRDSIKIKSVCFKEHYQEGEKATHTIGEKLENRISDKKRVSKIHKELSAR